MANPPNLLQDWAGPGDPAQLKFTIDNMRNAINVLDVRTQGLPSLPITSSNAADGFLTIDQWGGTGSNESQSDGTSEWPGLRVKYLPATQTTELYQSDDPNVKIVLQAGTGKFSNKTISAYDIRNKALLAERLSRPFVVAQCILGMVNLVFTWGQSFSVGEVGHPVVPAERGAFFANANLWTFGYSPNSATPTGSPTVWTPCGFNGGSATLGKQPLRPYTHTTVVPLYCVTDAVDDSLPGKNTGTGQSAYPGQNTNWIASAAYMREYCRLTLGDVVTIAMQPWNAAPICVFMAEGKSATAIEQHGKGGAGPLADNPLEYFAKFLSAAQQADTQAAIEWPATPTINIECVHGDQGQNNLIGDPDAYGVAGTYNSNSTAYQNAFVRLKTDFYNTVVRRAGSTQTERPMWYMRAPGGSYTRDRPDEQVFDALRHVADASSDMVVTGPDYPYMNLNHPDFNSYRTMGLKDGYVRWRVNNGDGWVPLQSIDHIILENEILCNYFTEFALQFVGVYDNDVYSQTMFDDKGFQVRDLSDNVLPIESVTLPAAALNGTCVLITLVSAPSGPVTVFYAADKFVHNGCGNLANTRPAMLPVNNGWGCYYYPAGGAFAINPQVGTQPLPYQNGQPLVFWDWALPESVRPALPYAGDI